jgi:hypothetical protein
MDRRAELLRGDLGKNACSIKAGHPQYRGKRKAAYRGLSFCVVLRS